MVAEFPCPCCGYLVFLDAPGSHAVCPVCCWEDDAVQLRWPHWDHGANEPSLFQAQRNYLRQGASDPRLFALCTAPSRFHRRDPEWRMVNGRDEFEHDASDLSWPNDFSTLYYWRRDYFRNEEAPQSGSRWRAARATRATA